MEKVEIFIGAVHHFMVKDHKVKSGMVIEEYGDRYLCQMQGIDIFYHIKKDGHIIVYCDTDHQEDELPSITTELREGIFFLDVNFLAEISFLFSGKPLSSEKYFLVSDMYVSRDFLLNKKTNTATRYQQGIDKDIDAKVHIRRQTQKVEK